MGQLRSFHMSRIYVIGMYRNELVLMLFVNRRRLFYDYTQMYLVL